MMEPWDGPAAVAFTDGSLIGAQLDRNGFRPLRYWVTDDDMVIMASEVGVLDVPASKVVMRGRIQPGRMFLVDTAAGRIVDAGANFDRDHVLDESPEQVDFRARQDRPQRSDETRAHLGVPQRQQH